MNKEEQLRIYSAYLPYGLQISTDDDGEDWVETVIGVNNEALETSVGNYWDFTVKPILYDLSYLTKEIEHEGKTFVPVEVLFGSSLAISGYTVYQDPQYKKFAHLTYVKTGLKSFPFLYEHYQKLLEWKLNVFNLSQDQFINKATLTNK